MKKQQNTKVKKNLNRCKEPIRKRMKMAGKFLHGTKGKPTNGPRGNKKY